MDPLFVSCIVVALLVGAGGGCAFYRSMLKKDPAKLERWAAEAKAVGERF